jgi:hypothetical protein
MKLVVINKRGTLRGLKSSPDKTKTRCESLQATLSRSKLGKNRGEHAPDERSQRGTALQETHDEVPNIVVPHGLNEPVDGAAEDIGDDQGLQSQDLPTRKAVWVGGHGLVVRRPEVGDSLPDSDLGNRGRHWGRE